MSTDRLLDRVRAANPVPAATLTNDALFAQIIARPGDARLAPSKRRRRVGTRGLALIAVAMVLTAGGGAFGAVQLVLSHASPKALFKADPAGQSSRRPGHTGGTGQTVIPKTVHLATTFKVPGVGRFEYWIAISRPNGWLCTAIRQPDRTWADLGGDRFQLGGPMPGCGTLPWHDAHGFAYDQSSMPSTGKRVWQVVYGYAPATGHPAKIRDTVSGTVAPIGDGRYFAIVMPLCRGAACDRSSPPGYRLQTLDAAGRVLVTDAYDPGE